MLRNAENKFLTNKIHIIIVEPELALHNSAKIIKHIGYND